MRFTEMFPKGFMPLCVRRNALKLHKDARTTDTFQDEQDAFEELNKLFGKCDDTQRATLLRVLDLWFSTGGNVHDLECFEADLKHNAANR